MGTIAEKLTYLNGTKQALKESINNIGGDITNETTFREYAQELDNIYDNLPKTTGEGTNLSLNTLKGKMNIIPKGDTEQDGTPTPSTPIDIEVVTGTQEVKVENVNLYADIQTQTLNGMTITKTNNGYILNGTTTANTTFRGTITNVANTNKTICAKCDTTITNANIQVKTRSSTQAQLRSISLGNANTWVVDSGTYEDYYCDIYVKSGVTLNNALVQPMLLNGTYTSSNIPAYTPHKEQTQTISLGDIELCKIGNYQDYLYKSGDKWYKKEYMPKETINENSTLNAFSGDANVDNTYLFSTPLTIENNSSNYITSHFTTATAGFSTNVIGSYTYNNTLRFRVPSTIATNLATLKTWLTNNNVTYYYVTNTPQDIEITDETLIEQLNNLEKLKSYNGTTNISSSGNLSAILSVSALKGES